MKYTPVGLLAAAALWVVPTPAYAQGKKPAAQAAAPEAPAEEPPAEAAAAEEPVAAEEGGDGLGDICEIDPAACPSLDMKAEAAKPLNEKIFAVQQRFIIKDGRFELQPFWGLTLNDQFVGHPGPGLNINYWITEVMAVGIGGQYYEPFNTDSAFNAQIRRAARVGVPLTEYQWAANANFTYVPASGKYAGFQNFIFHYDIYVLGGIGAISTRPIPVIDPDNRNFQYAPKVSFNAGAGIKIFFNRWFAAVMEVRDYIFIDELENTQIDNGDPTDPDTWLGESSLTNNVQANLGVSVFVPFSFDYRLPKAGADTAGQAGAK
ncbi:MAG TPA: outer membrane beta-barrel domain-containing protein [Polyangiaceae bacterium]|nr:outer membrane beta-barrel domain-containing protein [Polyangiaceae bacterium]